MEIKQRSSFLLSLVREVATGRMLPAAMQRPYVWGKADVEALCDSILSGFPIGSFLMWAPGPKADLTQLAKGRLGPILPAAKDSVSGYNPYSLLLDGQNRAATLAWMMLRDAAPELPDASDAERATWLGDERLVLDFASRSVKFVPSEEASSGLRLPAWTLVATASADAHGTANQLMRKLDKDVWSKFASQGDIDDFMVFWDHASARFREARTTETIIESATADEARHAFLRICRVGVPMAQDDFDRAIGWSAP